MAPQTVRYLYNLAWKNRQASASDLAQALSMGIWVTVTAQTVRRTLHYVNRCGRIQEKKSLFAVRHKTASLNFAEEHEKKPGEYWKHILWSDETKINLFSSDGVQHVWREPGQDYHSEYIVPAVKHGGGSVMIWGWMSAKGVGEFLKKKKVLNYDMATYVTWLELKCWKNKK